MPSSPKELPQLIGSKCRSCGEVIFPSQSVCPNCSTEDTELVKFGRRGKLYTYSVIRQQPPMYYKGSVPYAIGYVELPEGIRIKSLLVGCDFEALKVGIDMELVVERLHDDEEGNEVVTYMFTPA